jgi:ribosome biogenesis GTPase
MKGLVLSCSRNVVTVKPDAPESGSAETVKTRLTCGIKGKVLKGIGGSHNPLAPGDRVGFDLDPVHPNQGLIRNLETRRNVFTRFNRQGQTSQVLAANVDLILCVTTPVSPPFRPRFLDRVLLQTERAGIPVLILCNKQDLCVGGRADPAVEARLQDLSRIGYPVLRISVHTGEGMDELRSWIAGRLSVLLGQSGVGKSSLIKALVMDQNIRVGPLNVKYDRGNHTTAMAALLEISGLGVGTGVIDTPGMRRFVPDQIPAAELVFYLREFAPLVGKCTYGLSCSHRTEPGCKIREAVSRGAIHADRYESFRRLQDELSVPGYAH